MRYFVSTVLTAVVFMALLTVPVFGQSVNDLTMYTEEYPPFNFEDRGQLQGISIDLMDEMLNRTGSSLSKDDIQLVPWSLGYERAGSRPNTAIFAMTRTEAREDLFKWVGPISATKVVLTGRSDADISINSLADAENYTVGTVRDDVGETLLLDGGVSQNVIDSAPSPMPNARKLAAGRIDLWAYEESVARWLLRSIGENLNDYETYYVLSESELHFGFNPNTPDSVINALQGALDDMVADGTYDEIVARYLN